MALAVRELEETLTSAKAMAQVMRHDARVLHLPQRAALSMAAGVVGLLVAAALLVILLANKDAADGAPGLANLMSAPDDDEESLAEEKAQVAEARAEGTEKLPWPALRDELRAG